MKAKLSKTLTKDLPVDMQHSESNCQHDKVYADCILTSNPPQRDWVCRKCYAKGRDTIGSYSGKSEYDEIIGHL